MSTGTQDIDQELREIGNELASLRARVDRIAA